MRYIVETVAAVKNEEYKKEHEGGDTPDPEENDLTEISAEDDVFVAPDDPPPFFAAMFSDAEESEEEEEEDDEDEEEGDGDASADEFSRGVKTFLRKVKQRRQQRKGVAKDLITANHIGIEHRIVAAATFKKKYVYVCHRPYVYGLRYCYCR